MAAHHAFRRLPYCMARQALDFWDRQVLTIPWFNEKAAQAAMEEFLLNEPDAKDPDVHG